MPLAAAALMAAAAAGEPGRLAPRDPQTPSFAFRPRSCTHLPPRHSTTDATTEMVAPTGILTRPFLALLLAPMLAAGRRGRSGGS